MKTLRHLPLLPIAAALSLAACASGSQNGALPQYAPSAGAARPSLPGAAVRPRKSAGPFLYVENGDSTIAAYSIAKSGALTELNGSPYGSNTNSPADYSIAVDPKGPYVFVTGGVSDNVAIFSIGADGSLTSVSDSTNAGTSPNFPLFADSYKRLYVVNGDNGGSVAAFDVNKKAKLKAISGSPFQVTCPGFCTSNPDYAVIGGSYLYSIDTYGWYVSAFSIGQNGTLTELNSYATHYGPSAAVMTPNGANLYVTNGASADISAYSVSGGVLTQITGSPFAAGGTPQGIAMTSNGKFLYVANYGDGTISGYSIGSGGALTQLSGSPFADGTSTSPTALAVDKSNKHLFVTNQGTQAIAVYSISGSGAVAQINGSPFADSNAIGPRGLALYEP
jgi:6-phosphogluconolactonase